MIKGERELLDFCLPWWYCTTHRIETQETPKTIEKLTSCDSPSLSLSLYLLNLSKKLNKIQSLRLFNDVFLAMYFVTAFGRPMFPQSPVARWSFVATATLRRSVAGCRHQGPPGDPWKKMEKLWNNWIECHLSDFKVKDQ